MKKILLFILGCLLVSSLVSAKEVQVDEETKEICNRVMMNIYHDIFKAKGHHEELVDFNENVLSKNEYGIYEIRYRYKQTKGMAKERIYEFGLTIVGIEDEKFHDKGRYAFNLTFPILNLKFSGYQIKTFRASQFDIQTTMAEYGQVLWDHQQKYIPYQLTLKAVKDTFKIAENIEFIVTLTNLTQKNLIFKDLDQRTLFFLYNNRTWGAREVNPRGSGDMKEIILKSNEFIEKKFIGSGFLVPQEFEIYCSYVMTYKGVKPTATLKIKVVEDIHE